MRAHAASELVLTLATFPNFLSQLSFVMRKRERAREGRRWLVDPCLIFYIILLYTSDS